MRSLFLRSRFWMIGVLTTAILISACSIPNLEPQPCIESRTAVREFYSFHFGNGLAFSQEALKDRAKFLTPEYAKTFTDKNDGTDPFTTGDTDFPKAFRVGECSVVSPDRTSLGVLLFWRDESRTEQRKIIVEAVKQNGQWLIDKVSNK